MSSPTVPSSPTAPRVRQTNSISKTTKPTEKRSANNRYDVIATSDDILKVFESDYHLSFAANPVSLENMTVVAAQPASARPVSIKRPLEFVRPAEEKKEKLPHPSRLLGGTDFAPAAVTAAAAAGTSTKPHFVASLLGEDSTHTIGN